MVPRQHLRIRNHLSRMRARNQGRQCRAGLKSVEAGDLVGIIAQRTLNNRKRPWKIGWFGTKESGTQKRTNRSTDKEGKTKSKVERRMDIEVVHIRVSGGRMTQEIRNCK